MTPAKKQPRRKKMYPALTVIVAVSLLSVGLWWVVQKRFEPVATEDPLAGRMLTLERRMTSLEQRVEELAEAGNDKVKLVASNETWWLAEVERYLTEAGERVRNGADVRSALAALKSARSTLEGVALQDADPAAMDNIKAVLDTEIRLLEEYENPAAKRAMTLIDNTIRQLEQSAAPNKHPVAANEQAPAMPDDGLLANLAARFRRMVVVETQTVDKLQRLNRGLVIHSLVLAKTAILGGDVRSYRYAVANATRLLEQSDAFDRKAYNDLQVLQSIDITPSPPAGGETLREVRLLAAEILP